MLGMVLLLVRSENKAVIGAVYSCVHVFMKSTDLMCIPKENAYTRGLQLKLYFRRCPWVNLNMVRIQSANL